MLSSEPSLCVCTGLSSAIISLTKTTMNCNVERYIQEDILGLFANRTRYINICLTLSSTNLKK